MSTDVIGIDLDRRQRTLAEKILRAGQARALVDFAKDIEADARSELEAEAHADVARAGGGGFTRKVDGVQAVLTDPKPKPHVTDQDAFERWWADAGLEHAERLTVEVADPHEAAGCIQELMRQYVDADPQGETVEVHADTLWVLLREAVEVRTEYVLPEKPLDRLLDTGRCVATDAGLIDTTTGEFVPGVECTRSKPTLQVRPDKTAKARDRALVASYFGLPAQLPGGDA